MSFSVHHRLRLVTDRAARWSGILARRERDNAEGLTVLMHHRVLPDERCADYPLPSLAMPQSAFREELRWLSAHGDVLPLNEALARNEGRKKHSRPLFAITLDDGYDDSAQIAAPALEEQGLRATFFVTTGFIGAREPLWFDKAIRLFGQLADSTRREILRQLMGARRIDPGAYSISSAVAWIGFLKRCSPIERRELLDALELAAGPASSIEDCRAMSVEELVTLHRRGHEIGSHTVTHPMLPELDDEALAREMQDSRDALVGWLGCEIPGFCYPNGDCDPRVAAAVERVGHRYACTTRDGIHRAHDDPFHIRRVDVVPARVLDGALRFDPIAFRRELCGLYRRRGPAHIAG